jgi:methionyl-tRNA formyltransferase
MLNRAVAHWLSTQSELAGCVWIANSARWMRSREGRKTFTKRRVERVGALRALDEAAFHFFYHLTAKRSYNTRAASALVNAYWKQVGLPIWGPFIMVPGLASKAVEEYVQSLHPDAIFTHCIHDYFGKRVRDAARYGAFLWHVGILPEYRGLYAPFWTMHNADFENFGYTLFRLSDKIDAGEIFVQGNLDNVDIRRDNHHLIETKAVLGSLPAVGKFIRDLENGTARPIERKGATARYYSYPGITDYVRQRWRVHRAIRRLNGRASLSDVVTSWTSSSDIEG